MQHGHQHELADGSLVLEHVAHARCRRQRGKVDPVQPGARHLDQPHGLERLGELGDAQGDDDFGSIGQLLEGGVAGGQRRNALDRVRTIKMADKPCLVIGGFANQDNFHSVAS